jgi:hypothetical protein
MDSDYDFYSTFEDIDLPEDNMQKQVLAVAKKQAELEVTSELPEKIYLVKGYNIFVCHKSQCEIKRKINQMGEILRDIEIKDARMVTYGKDGLRKIDK